MQGTTAVRLWQSNRRARLLQLEPTAARHLRSLFGTPKQRVVTVDSNTSAWRLSPPTEASGEWLELAGARHSLWLMLQTDAWCKDIGPRTWWDYADEARLLAWTLAHEELLTHLGAWLGDDLRPVAIRGRSAGMIAGTKLGWDGYTSDGRHAGGNIVLLPAVLAEVAADAAWQIQAQTSTLAWANIPTQLRIALPTPALTAAEWRAFEPGDVMLLTATITAWSSLLLATAKSTHWKASYRDGRLTVGAAIANKYPPEKKPMTGHDSFSGEQPNPAVSGPGQQQTDMANDIGDIPVEISLDLGRLDITLGELSGLQPGYVFDLSEPLEKARVTIRANGSSVGHGELVVLGDNLGVRLLDLDPNGIR